MTDKEIKVLVLALFIMSLTLTACQVAPTEAPTPTVVPLPTKAPEPTEIPEPTEVPPPIGPFGTTIEALQGIEVEFWHFWNENVGETLEALVEEFNLTNDYGIQVVPLNQGSYSDIFRNMNAAINTGDLPNLVIGYDNQYLAWDSAGDVIEDMTPYVDNPYFGFTEEEIADFYPAFWISDDIDGERLGIPIQRSGQYYFYNYSWAKQLGFDRPPTTPEEFKEQACASAKANNTDDIPDNDDTGGVFFKTDASIIVNWIWAFGGEVEVPGEGYDFNTPEALEALTFLYDLLSEGCAWSPKSQYPYLEFANRLGLFHASSITGVPYQIDAFADAASEDEWMAIPIPSESSTPVVDLYGPSIAMITSTPEEQLASWVFLKWFTEPENQAKLIESSGYYPTRASTLAFLGDYMANNPIWSDSLQYLQYGKIEPRFESWRVISYAVNDALALLMQEGFTADQIPQFLAELQEEVEEIHTKAQE